MTRRHNGPLAVAILIIAIDDHPILRHAKFMGARCVGIKHRVMSGAALGV